MKTLEENGIGRPSTYAPTISTIISRGYVTREKKRIYPTELGTMVTELMQDYFSDIVDTEFTAEMENRLDGVEEGTQNWKQVLRDFYPGFEKELEVAEKEIEKIEIKDEVSDVPCDQCGAMMVYKMGRYGKFLACPNFPTCRNTKPILTYIDAPCPKCGKPVRVYSNSVVCQDEDCGWKMWRLVAGKPVTDRMLQALLAGKTTEVIRGFHSKSGKRFDAALRLNEALEVEFVFQKKQSLSKKKSSW